MKRPSGWTLAWVGWLGFLLLDFVAALKERGGKSRVLTLSRHVWKWFPRGWQRSVLTAFIAAVGAHLVFEASAWWLLTALPVAATIVDAVAWGGRNAMIFEKQVKALAIKLGLRWLGARVAGARESGSEAMKMLDGWRTWISAVVWIGDAAWALISGQDLTPIARGIADAMNWETPTGQTLIFYGLVANPGLAMWGAGMKLWKAYRQRQAGAAVSELLGPIGYVKAAAADGTLASATKTPVVLTMTDKASTPAKVEPVVARVVAEPTPSPAPKLSPLPVR